MSIIIDPEFKNLIPPLSEDELKQLEENCVKDGIREPLVVWPQDDGNEILIDGHNRWNIVAKHHGTLGFHTTKVDFKDREEAMVWIIDNQFGRRNLDDVDRIELAQKKTDILSQKARERQREGGRIHNKAFVQMDKSNSDKPLHVRDEIAKITGISSGTIARFEQVQKHKPELIDNIRKGEMSINQAYKTVKRQEQKQAREEALKTVVAEAEGNNERPVLYVGNGIGYRPNERYDLLLTDPPYSTDVPDIETFAESWLPNALANVKDTGFAYVFIGAYPDELKAYLNITPPSHLKLMQVLVWSYRNTLGVTPKDRYNQSYQICLFYRGVNAPDLYIPLASEKWAVMEVNAPGGITVESTGDEKYHSWQKPMEIAERFIRHSTKKGMTVFDPFACTGTFLVAAAKLGRKAYGFEINPDNAEFAERRGCLIG